jgi:hypothetical protein
MLVSFPDDRVRITVLTNTPGPTAGPLTNRIEREVLGLGPAPEAEQE